MPRIIFSSGAALALVALALAVTDWALSRQPGVTEANARRIRLGMTIAEVESVFGGPAEGDLIKTWRGAHGEALVLFDELGGVCSMRFLAPCGKKCLLRLSSRGPVDLLDWYEPATPRSSPSLLDRLRAWLGW